MKPKRCKTMMVIGVALLSPGVQAQLSPAQAQPRANWPQSDPSGSRGGVAYARRYQVVTRLITRGEELASDDELSEVAVLALQRAAVNRAQLTFVDMHLDDTRRTLSEVRESGDYDTGLPGTPRRGSFLAPTDRLELTVTVESRVSPKRIGGRVLGQGVEYSQLEEGVRVGLSGRIISLDRGALAYALQPVLVEHQATRDRRIEADKHVTLFGIEVPFLPPLSRAGGSQSSTSRRISLLQQTFDEAADRLVGQLEVAPPLPLTGLPATTRALFVESQDASGRTVYLSGRDAVGLRRGDAVLLPVVALRQQQQTSRLVLKAVVTAEGELVEAHLQDGSLNGLEVDESRPLRVLRR